MLNKNAQNLLSPELKMCLTHFHVFLLILMVVSAIES
jgi:hypothetical protein